jgi:serine/threonine-protein kinase HipA
VTTCPFCLRPSLDPECALRFSGTATVPTVRVSSSEIAEIISAQAEKIGGVQPKFTAEISDDGAGLEPRPGGRFIVKPQVEHIRHLPENEHLAMSMARAAGIEVPEFALLSLVDGVPVYVCRRFDVNEGTTTGHLHQLDFCQLLELPAEQKYSRPAIDCVEVVRRYSVDPDSDVPRAGRRISRGATGSPSPRKQLSNRGSQKRSSTTCSRRSRT